MSNFAQLQAFRQRVPFCSQAALEGILTLASTEGIPANHKRKHIRESIEKVIQAMRVYGPLLVTVTAMTVTEEPMELIFANIFSYLAGAYSASGAFADYLDLVHSQCPSSFQSPWKCIIYADEIHPGNQLAGSARKSWAVYFSFAQFGGNLSKPELWFTLLIKRADQVAMLAANIGQCLRLILEHMFGNSHAHPHAGVLLKRASRTLKLYWSFGYFLQDGSAHKFTYSNKQDGGSRVCMACKNIFVLQSKEDEEGSIQLAKFTKHHQLEIATDDELLQSWSRMQARKTECAKDRFKSWTQATGISFSEHALLLSSSLREQQVLKPISQWVHDYMHGLCCNGVLSWVTFLLIKAFFDNGVKDIWQKLHGFVQVWQQPAVHKCCLQRLFDTKAVQSHRAAGKFKSSASEMLALYRVLAYYVEFCCLPHGLCTLECQSYLSWARVLDYCVAIKSLENPDPSFPRALVEKALGDFVQAGWSSEFRPKMHWCLHFSDALRLHHQLPGVWALERKHKDVRKYGNILCNTSQWDKSMLSSLVAEHMYDLEMGTDLFRPGPFLENTRKPTKKMTAALCQLGLGQDFLCSNSCRLASGGTVTAGDVVYLQSTAVQYEAGQIHSFFQSPVAGDLALVERFKCQEVLSTSSVSKWIVCSPRHLAFVQLGDIECPVTYSSAKGKVTCLTPAYLWAKEEEKSTKSCTLFKQLSGPFGVGNPMATRAAQFFMSEAAVCAFFFTPFEALRAVFLENCHAFHC